MLLPVLGGAFLNQYFQGLVKLVSPVMPTIAVVTVATLCGKAIAQSASAILASGQQVVLAAALLHTLGFFFGYILSRMLGLDVSSSRSISFEVGVKVSICSHKKNNPPLDLAVQFLLVDFLVPLTTNL